MNDFCPDDAICIEEPTCMESGRAKLAVFSTIADIYYKLEQFTKECYDTTQMDIKGTEPAGELGW